MANSRHTGLSLCPCGIYYEVPPSDDRHKEKRWLPLISLSAHGTICQNSSRLTLKQAFSNPKEEAISEAAYSFPIYEGAAIVDFSCKIGQRIIRGVVRDHHTARKIYETAKEEGQQAALMIYNTPDVWSTKISNIPAAGKVEVEITVVSELKHDAQVDGIRFMLPTTIAPRYDNEPDNLAPMVSPRSRGIQITCAITMTTPIKSLQSPSHPIEVGLGSQIPNTSLSKEEFDLCKGYATLSQNDTALDKDFVLIIVSDGSGEPQAIVETHSTLPNSRALFLSLVPKFNLPRIKPEIVFIADRSGSMQPHIPQLKNAMRMLLRSLPVGVKFNICSFGSTHSFLWPKSRPYDQENLNTALKHVETFDSSYNGTEMFPPVEAAFKNRYRDLETEIIVLTDGQIWRTEALFKLVQEECESGRVRLFSVGIGGSVSHALVEGLARAGKGYAQIVGDEEKLDVKVVQMLKSALGVHVKEYQLIFPDDSFLTRQEVGEKDEDGGFEFVEREEGTEEVIQRINDTKLEESDDIKQKVISLYDTTAVESPDTSSKDRFSHLPAFQPPSRLQTPYQIPPLYTFSRTNLYNLLSGSETIPRSVTVRGTTTSGDTLELEVPVKDVGKGTTVHQLAAKKLLKELEEGGSYLHSGEFGVDPKDEGKFMDWVEREAVRVGTTFGVAGKWTSFVAVEDVAGLEQKIQQREEDYGVTLGSHSGDSPVHFLSALSPSRPYPPPAGKRRVVSSRCAAVPQSGEACEATRASYDGMGSSAQHATPISPIIRTHGVRAKRLMSKDEGRQLVYGKSGFLDVPLVQVPRISSKLETALVKTGDDHASKIDDHASKTYALSRMQAFDGSFPSGSGKWAPKLAEAFKNWIREKHEEGGVATLQAVSEEELEKLLAAAVAMAIFETDLKDSKDLWEMVMEKTDAWGVGKVGETAWNVLRRWVNGQVNCADDSDKQSFWLTSEE